MLGYQKSGGHPCPLPRDVLDAHLFFEAEKMLSPPCLHERASAVAGFGG